MRTLYAFEGSGITVAGEVVDAGTGAVVHSDQAIEVESADAAEVLVLQGRPIGEPVAQYGPFVMNDEAGIEQAIADYRATGFGGWPWPSEEFVHGADPARSRASARRHTRAGVDLISANNVATGVDFVIARSTCGCTRAVRTRRTRTRNE